MVNSELFSLELLGVRDFSGVIAFTECAESLSGMTELQGSINLSSKYAGVPKYNEQRI